MADQWRRDHGGIGLSNFASIKIDEISAIDAIIP
jgi:hypothetical protein